MLKEAFVKFMQQAASEAERDKAVDGLIAAHAGDADLADDDEGEPVLQRAVGKAQNAVVQRVTRAGGSVSRKRQ